MPANNLKMPATGCQPFYGIVSYITTKEQTKEDGHILKIITHHAAAHSTKVYFAVCYIFLNYWVELVTCV